MLGTDSYQQCISDYLADRHLHRDVRCDRADLPSPDFVRVNLQQWIIDHHGLIVDLDQRLWWITVLTSPAASRSLQCTRGLQSTEYWRETEMCRDWARACKAHCRRIWRCLQMLWTRGITRTLDWNWTSRPAGARALHSCVLTRPCCWLRWRAPAARKRRMRRLNLLIWQ